MRKLPGGTVTFLFTDVEGSTRLSEELGDGYAAALGDHRRALRAAFALHGGIEVDTQGDAFFVAFSRASDALAAAAEVQAAPIEPIRVRIGVHTGEPVVTEEGYVGIDVHRAARIAAAGHGGQVLVSQTTRDLVGGDGLRDLGEHRLKDLTRAERIFQFGEGEFPPLKSLNRTNLPVAAWPLLGRERELAEIERLVGEGARLLTLTGPGGSGKTRLALQAAAELLGRFPDGVFFVALAPLREAALVPAAIAAALEVPPDGDVLAALATQRVLLILDNAEHLQGVDVVVAELLGAARDVVVLVTSRGPLRLSAERELPVEPLPEGAAVELFAARAAAVGRPIAPRTTVRAICARLDNLPLAIELAAARARVLSPDAILQRLERALPLLTGGARDVPVRQRTLRATIAWSYDLLDAEERVLFRRLAVFRASFTLDAAEAVADAGLDALTALVDRGLVKPVGRDRFLMLETIREFAAELLAEDPDLDAVQRRAVDHFLAFAEREALGLLEFDGDARDRVEGEHENLGVAIEWALEHAPELALRFVSALYRFWLIRGPLEQGRGWTEAALARNETASPEALAEAVLAAAFLAATRNDFARGRERATAALALCRSLGDDVRISAALTLLGIFAVEDGDIDAAISLHSESLQFARAAGSGPATARALNNLGEVMRLAGDDDGAAGIFRECIEVARNSRYPHVIYGLFNLAELELDRGHLGEAASLSRESVIEAQTGSRTGLVYALGVAAMIATAEGQPVRAAMLRAAADSLSAAIGFVPERHPRQQYEMLDASARAALGDDRYEAACAAGRALSVEAAVALACSLDSPE